MRESRILPRAAIGGDEAADDAMATASDTPGIVTHLTAAERAARGKAARNRASLASHGEWSAAPDRPDPVALLEEQAATRVPELVPIRYGRMLTSPFAFYRGGAYLMASDLAAAAAHGADGAALRGRAPLQLRRLRLG